MPKTIKSITNPKLRLEILTPAEIKKIHEATLWIIEKVGVRFPSKRALDIWAAHGAAVDTGKMIVRAKGEPWDHARRFIHWPRGIPTRICSSTATTFLLVPMAAGWR